MATPRNLPEAEDRYEGPLAQRAYDVLQASLLKAFYAYDLFAVMKPPVASLGPERLAIASGATC